ncbi:MAG: tetratricopeptide repeat protein [Halioglobus sp.]
MLSVVSIDPRIATCAAGVVRSCLVRSYTAVYIHSLTTPKQDDGLQIITELRKRKVLTSALFYVPFAWITAEVLTFLLDRFRVLPWAADLVAAAFVAGFPAFLVLAWTFDVGPEGITRTSASRAQGCVAALFAALIMVMGTTGLFFLIESGQPISTAVGTAGNADEQPVNASSIENSIAVYAFENLSSDPENAYFSKGMTSELITRLSQVKELRIAAIAQTKEEVLALGLEPQANYRLEGSVRRAGNTVRISTLLTDLHSGFTVWSDEFDGNLEDVFALQEQAALRIIQALGLELSSRETVALSARDTDNIQAYDAFLRGWSLIESLHVSFDGAAEKLNAARQNFQQALTIDPGYTRAIAGLSMVESNAIFLGLESEDSLPLAREFAEEALARDDSLHESHFAMARVLLNGNDNPGAVAEYRKVVELDSQNGYAWCEMSAVLNTEDPVGAENAARQAIRYRPAYSLAYYNLGAALQKQDRLSEAIDAFQQSLQLDPTNRSLRGIVEQLNGRVGSEK